MNHFYNYALNWFGSDAPGIDDPVSNFHAAGTKVRIEAMTTPAQKVLLSDAPTRGTIGNGAPGSDTYDPTKQCNYTSGPGSWWYVPIHGQTINVMYADGHAGLMKPQPTSVVAGFTVAPLLPDDDAMYAW